MKRLIALSGPVATGKTELCRQLESKHGAVVFRTTDYLIEQLGRRRVDRTSLQRAGERIDRLTDGRWVVDALTRFGPILDDAELVVIDCVRIRPQLIALRRAFGRRVVHLHLTATLETLAQRYAQRQASGRIAELASYADLRRSRTERNVHQLAADADIVIDTDRTTAGGILVRAAAHLHLSGNPRERLVDVLVGGQYGSEGKGNVSAHLASEYDVLVRSGGPNAGHTVMTDSGRHVQHHLPSGTALCEATLVLTSGAVIDTAGLLAEIAASQVEAGRLVIDAQATIITDQHKALEAALVSAIGSTGSGVGAATAARIMGRSSPALFAQDVPALGPYIGSAHTVIQEALTTGRRVFVEGTQGTGLSLLHGPYPHVTSRDTTVSGLLAEAGIAPSRLRKTIMVCRTYPIRVQSPSEEGRTSGPMHNEIDWQTIARRSGLDIGDLLAQERTSTTGRQRRVSEFDWELLQRSAVLNGPTDIALTFVDQLDRANQAARRFDQLTPAAIGFIQEVERVAAAPVTLISTRFHQRSIIDRRSW